MRKESSLQGKWWNVVFFITTLLVVAADQLSKLWISSNLVVGQSLPEAGFFRLTRVHNTGAVFGLFQGQSFALTVVILIVVAILLLYILFISRRLPYLDNMLGKSAFGLILGGAVGNLIDRLRFGYVTDFIDIGIWPVFNIADSAVVVGTIILAYSLLRLVRAEKHEDGRSI